MMNYSEYEKDKYKSKTLEMKVLDLSFIFFFSSRYSMTVKINAINTYNYSKKNNIPFFNLTLGCLLEVINEIPEFKRRIIKDKIIEYEKINAVTPILQKDNSIREIEIVPISNFENFNKWNEYVQFKKKNIEELQYKINASNREEEPIANFSCIPWINFESMTNVTFSSHQIMPCISWGKLTDDKISISLTANHNFIFGFHFKLFYENIEKYLCNPQLLVEKKKEK